MDGSQPEAARSSQAAPGLYPIPSGVPVTDGSSGTKSEDLETRFGKQRSRGSGGSLAVPQRSPSQGSSHLAVPQRSPSQRSSRSANGRKSRATTICESNNGEPGDVADTQPKSASSFQGAESVASEAKLVRSHQLSHLKKQSSASFAPQTSASWMMLRHQNNDGQTHLDQILRVGDIMRIERAVVDHVILVVGKPERISIIQTDDGYHVDVWRLQTLESASNLEHSDVSAMAMVVDPTDGCRIKAVATNDPTDVCSWEPVAVFLSPFQSDEVDQEIFAECVDKVVDRKQGWSKKTAINSARKSAKICKDEYSDDASKAELVAKLKETWESSPICTTMPIRVWQMYITEYSKENATVAGDLILKTMPAFCDRCLPQELWGILEETRIWVEILHAHWHTSTARKFTCQPTKNTESSDADADHLRLSLAEHSTPIPTVRVTSLAPKNNKCCRCLRRNARKSMIRIASNASRNNEEKKLSRLKKELTQNGQISQNGQILEKE